MSSNSNLYSITIPLYVLSIQLPFIWSLTAVCILRRKPIEWIPNLAKSSSFISSTSLIPIYKMFKRILWICVLTMMAAHIVVAKCIYNVQIKISEIQWLHGYTFIVHHRLKFNSYYFQLTTSLYITDVPVYIACFTPITLYTAS